jgi:hypothetical protein
MGRLDNSKMNPTKQTTLRQTKGHMRQSKGSQCFCRMGKGNILVKIMRMWVQESEITSYDVA